MNVRLRESWNQAKFTELLFDSEESQVIGIDSGKFFGGVIQGKGKDIDIGAVEILREIGISTFNGHAGFFSGDNSGCILQPVKNAVMDLLHDIVDGNGSTGILEAKAAVIAGGGGKQGAVGGQDVEAQKSQFLDKRNQGMKDLLVTGFSEAGAEIGECGLTGDPISAKPCPSPIALTMIGISKDKAEVLDGSNSFQVTKQIEKKKRNGIVARPSEDGISIGGNGADEGEIDNGSYQLRDAAAEGTVVVDMDEFLSKFVMRKPAIQFFGKGFTVTAIDERIDFLELTDKIANREAGGFAHLKAPGVSREDLQASKMLPGTPFLFANTLHPILPKGSDLFQTEASGSS